MASGATTTPLCFETIVPPTASPTATDHTDDSSGHSQEPGDRQLYHSHARDQAALWLGCRAKRMGGARTSKSCDAALPLRRYVQHAVNARRRQGDEEGEGAVGCDEGAVRQHGGAGRGQDSGDQCPPCFSAVHPSRSCVHDQNGPGAAQRARPPPEYHDALRVSFPLRGFKIE